VKLKYAIIGTGALGGYYGGRLAHAGAEVHFLFHSDFEYVKQNGLKVDSVNGNFHLTHLNAYRSTADMPVCDVVLVCLKTTNNYLLAEMLTPLLHSNTVVVLVQNGLGIEADLAQDFPDTAIAGGLAFICSSKIGNGHIAHFDMGNIRIGLFQGNMELIEQMCLEMRQAGIHAEAVHDLNYARWQKLVWNIPYNGLTVVLNATTDEMMKQPDSRKLIYDLMLEVIAGANACGAKLSTSFADKMLETTDKMTPYAPSMKLDFEARRQMEIEAIYWRPIKAALEAGFDMKKVTMLAQQLMFIQNTYRK
jgi:2-dehydropantoate 2-reductase